MKENPKKLECAIIDNVECVINSESGRFGIAYRLLSVKCGADYYLIERTTDEESELVSVGQREGEAREIYTMLISAEVTPCTLRDCVNNLKCQA